MQSNAEITVLFASVFPAFRGRVAKVLENRKEIHVACAQTANEVLPLADVHHPQIAVLDLDIDLEKVCELAGNLSLREIPTLLISDNIDESKAFELLRHGISGVIPRETSPEMLYKSVRAVASGEIWISRGTVAQLVSWMQTTHAESPEPIHGSKNTTPNSSENRFHLTPREIQIVEAVGEGMTNNEISSHLAISKNTVKQHLVNIFDKCGVSSRLELAMFVVHHRLLGLNIREAEMALSPAASARTSKSGHKQQDLIQR